MMDHVEIEMPKISIEESVEAVEHVLQDRISERICEQIGVGQVPKISSQDSVEAVIFCVSRERICEWMCEQIGVVEVPKISCQESVEAAINCPSGTNLRTDWGYESAQYLKAGECKDSQNCPSRPHFPEDV